MKRVFILSLSAALASACSTSDGDASDDAATSAADTAAPATGDDGPVFDGTGPGGTVGGDAGQTGDTDDGADSSGGAGTGSTFLVMPDGGSAINECNQWTQDCPKGEKCMPWASDGGSWNATRCSEIADNPGQVGDVCSVEGSGASGIDDCDISSMCYYVDPETNNGTCVSMCFGAPEAPLCDPGFACSISNDGVLTLCRAECDPLIQDCDNSVCLPAAGADAFVCIVDASGEAGAAGDPCEFLNSCDGGNLCLDASAFTDCSASGCCSQFCDLTEKDPDSACTLPAHECVAYFEEGEAPPQLAHVGFCGTPA